MVLSKTMLLALAAQASGLVLPMSVGGQPTAARATPAQIRMMSSFDEYIKSKQSGAAAPPAAPAAPAPPKQNFDNDMSGWKPPSGGGNAHSLGADSSAFTATDTPDFVPEEGSRDAALAAGIGYTDGMAGSQADPNRKKSSGPELAGALDSDPDIYVPEIEEVVADASAFVLPEASWKLSKMEVSQTDEDFEMFTASTDDKQLVIDVKPVCMTFEDFHCGFTADSHPAFSVSPSAGKMERRNGDPTTLTITCDPQGASGELVGYLCFILPDEKDFSSFYKITCTSR